MLDIKWIRENRLALEQALRNRGSAPEAAKAEVEKLIRLDEARRAHIVELEQAQARRNAASKEIGKAKAQKDEATAARLMNEVAGLKSFLQEAEEKGRALDKALEDALAVIPNVPLDDVPVGPDEHANKLYRNWGEKPNRWGNEFKPKEHFELGEALGMMDFETAAKLSGSRFVVLKRGLARIERALGQFMLDLHTQEHGYEEVQPPLLVRNEVMFGTGQLPKFFSDQFFASTTALSPDVVEELNPIIQGVDRIASDTAKLSEMEGKLFRHLKQRIVGTEDGHLVELLDGIQADLADARQKAQTLRTLEATLGAVLQGSRWLIPTAEVPLTNLVRESILDEGELPLRFTALTPSFRAEAGAAGKDTRGMLRQHQFNKVELVSITTPEQSRDEHERMLVSAEEVLKRLDLAYRVMTLSTGDMGFSAQKTYDIEVWLPGQGTFREISSCSLCGDFQARRMQARYRPKDPGSKSGAGGKGTRLVHTLNGSGVAVGRALIAVMENYQNPDGSITVPDALRPYMGGLEKVGP
jgi:seryl-tRNA synthetase